MTDRAGAAPPRLVLWALVVLTSAGCPQSVTPPPPPPPPPPDDAGAYDGSMGIGVDSDGDGLCDRTESSYRTDVLDPDSDDDGYPDGTEVIDGDSPTLPSEPLRERVVFVTEAEDATASTTVSIVVRGAGESYVGAFESFSTRDAFARSAGDLYAGSSATVANPPDNVVRVEDESFVAVTGRTLLSFEVRFAFAGELPRSCASAYPWRYNIKRQDGRLVSSQRYILVVLPVGTTPTTATWCTLAGCF